MQTITINHGQTERFSREHSISLFSWVPKLIAFCEENRFGVVATLILLQVSIAGFNVVIPPMIHASVYLMAPGICLAFVSNGIALAQVPIRWVLAGFLLSMIVNAAISIYCFAQLF